MPQNAASKNAASPAPRPFLVPLLARHCAPRLHVGDGHVVVVLIVLQMHRCGSTGNPIEMGPVRLLALPFVVAKG